MRRSRVLLLAGMLVPAAAFMYGGWSVTTVDEVPEFAVAGKPFDVTYTVRQHGFTLLNDLHGSLTARSGRQTNSVNATPLGQGRYRASIAIPSAGTWDMKIDNGFLPKSGYLLPLRVLASNAPAPASMPAADRGHQLFLAKGCATCHSHQLVDKSISIEAGPDLSEPKFTSAYLSRFLANPDIKKDWRSEARMPNLGLKPAEIAALAAFLNQRP